MLWPPLRQVFRKRPKTIATSSYKQTKERDESN